MASKAENGSIWWRHHVIAPSLAKGKPKVDIDASSYMRESLKETHFQKIVAEAEINNILSALNDFATGHGDILLLPNFSIYNVISFHR